MAPTLRVEKLEKRFGGRRVIKGLSFEILPGEVIGVSGPNGSGKSTLLQILCGLQRPTRGRVAYEGEPEGEPTLKPAQARHLIGFASPAVQMYDELSATENLRFFATWRGISIDAPALLERVGLDPKRRDPLRTYSSGMRQRVKLAWAISHDPPILMLDEPGANLDAEGRALVESLVAERKAKGWVVIASNDPEELALATREVSLV